MSESLGLSIMLFLRLFLGIAFVLSFMGKIRDLRGFQNTVANFQLVPAAFVGMFARTIIIVEAAIVFLMVFGGTLLFYGFVASTLLLTSFVIALGGLVIRKIRTPCNCFGKSDQAADGVELFRTLGFWFASVTGCILFPVTRSGILSKLTVEESLLVISISILGTILWIHLRDLLLAIPR